MSSTRTTSALPRSLPREKPHIGREHLLTTRQMAEFTVNGFLRFDNLAPRELCAELTAELDAGLYKTYETEGVQFSEVWPEPLAAGRIFRLPAVAGIIESLVGPNCRYDHHYPHTTTGPEGSHQVLHQDAEIDPRPEAFDIQISLFPQDTPREMGGTMFVPGSHFRRVHESEIGRYQNIIGQVQAVCEAGTMFFWHHNLWHAGRANYTPRTRYMFKLRLNPMVRQVRLWNTDDLNDPEVNKTLLSRAHAWHGQAERVEQINRMRLWRHLTGDPSFDCGFYLTRTENEPRGNYQRSV